MSRAVQNAINVALNDPKPAKNFVTSDDARNIAAAAKADGKVTRDEIKQVTDLHLQPSFFSDDLFEGQGKWNFDKPTASGNAYGVLHQFLRENSLKHAVEGELHEGGFVGFNFLDSAGAERVVQAAKADGRIDASERHQLENLRMGWSYRPDSDKQNPDARFDKPTLSVTAGNVINAALREVE